VESGGGIWSVWEYSSRASMDKEHIVANKKECLYVEKQISHEERTNKQCKESPSPKGLVSLTHDD